MVELADTLDLGSSAERRGGSTPSMGTKYKKLTFSELFLFGGHGGSRMENTGSRGLLRERDATERYSRWSG